jgi:AraC family transcriptional regulator of adaptative response/methylated-DNA-[protein]-cysteine methyltransferase
MVRAMRANDAAYNGRFYVGVHSTGIFCLPSCRARLPKLENVRFYFSREDALASGLRGCKRCRAEAYPNTLPGWLYTLIEHLRAHCEERMSECRLAELAGVNASTIRRHFKEALGITPLAFHRKLRLEHARQLLMTGHNYLDAAYAIGYESPSAFREAFVRQFGKPPGEFYANH